MRTFIKGFPYIAIEIHLHRRSERPKVQFKTNVWVCHTTTEYPHKLALDCVLLIQAERENAEFTLQLGVIVATTESVD